MNEYDTVIKVSKLSGLIFKTFSGVYRVISCCVNIT